MPSSAGQAKFLACMEQPKLYSKAVGGSQKKRYKLMVTTKDSNSPDNIKYILKFRINPTDIRACINSLKTLRNGTVQIETGNKGDIEILIKDIHDKCRDKLEVLVHKLGKTRIIF